MDTKELEQILRILKENDVREFELDDDGVRMRLSRGAKPVVEDQLAGSDAPAATAQPYFISGVATTVEEVKGEAVPESIVTVESPIVGTFYRKPSPDADAFVMEGAIVKRGQTLCIIEAMKIMNEIESPCNGRVVKILLDDGQVCEYAEKLFLIDTAV